ncbi:MAG: tetratricopeptide repeat protein [bacterium]|nr:tetratricopeptide repeat protein [bacterium]
MRVASPTTTLARVCLILALAASVPLTACRKQTPDQMLTEAQRLTESQDIIGAELKYKEFLEQYPQDPLASQARWGLASCYMMDKDYEKAREELDNMIKAEGGAATEPGYNAFEMKLYSYVQEGQPRKALDLALATSDTLKAAPPQIKYFYQLRLSDLYALNKDDEKALAIDRRLIDQGPSGPQHLNALQMMEAIYVHQKNLPAAIKVYEDYLAKYPDTSLKASLIFEVGRLQKQMGQEDLARKSFDASEAQFRSQFEKALGAEEKSELLFQLSLVQRFRGDWAGTRATLQRILDEFPTSRQRPNAMLNLAEAWMGEKKSPQAVATLEKIMRDYPNTNWAAQAAQWIQAIRNPKAQTGPTTGTLTAPTTGTLPLAFTTGTLTATPTTGTLETAPVAPAASAGPAPGIPAPAAPRP